MLRQFLGVMVHGEFEGIRRRMRRAALNLAALAFALLALFFAFVALFLRLAIAYEPWLAALIVGAILLLAALTLWGAGRIGYAAASRRRSQTRARTALDEAAMALKAEDTSIAALAAVLAIGFAIGRGISK